MPLELTLAERRRILAAARSFAAKTRLLILRKLAAGPAVKLKADRSPVTDADLAAETLLRRLIMRRFPGHGILGEEFPSVRPEARTQWLLDPIDGTLGYSRGIPLYGTIIGVHHDGRPAAGVIDLPSLGETFSAGAGLGAWLGAKRIRVGKPRKLSDEIIAICYRDQFLRSGQAGAFDRVMSRHGRVRTYGDCFGHALAACGRVGAMIDVDINPWDIAATEVMIREAGGKYVRYASRTFQGKPRHDIVCGKREVVDWLLPLLR